MKPLHIIVLLIGTGTMICSAIATETGTVESKLHSVTAKELDEGTAVIIGELGLPLRTAVEIEATVEEEHFHYSNEPTGLFLLKIDKIAGVKLKESITLSFGVASMYVAMAESQDALDKLVTTLAVRTFRPSQPVDRFRERYIGSRHKLVVFEVAQFEGWPSFVPEDCFIRDTGLSNHNPRFSLVVMAERKL